MKPCERCRKEFQPKTKEQKYCSKWCAHVLRNHTMKPCELCQTEFLGSSNMQFCSMACADSFRRRSWAEEKAAKENTPMKPCEMCQKEFRPTNNREKYCSEICSDAARYRKRHKEKKANQVYIIKLNHEGLPDIYKIGISNNPQKRLQSLNSASPFELEIVHQFTAEPAEEAEALLHKQFESGRMNGEWFRLTDEQLTGLKSITSFVAGQFE